MSHLFRNRISERGKPKTKEIDTTHTATDRDSLLLPHARLFLGKTYIMPVSQILMLIIVVCTFLLQNMGIPVQITNGQAPEQPKAATSPITSEMATLSTVSSEVVSTPIPAPSTIVDTEQWKQYLWAAGDRNVLYQTDTPRVPGTFYHKNSLGGDFAHRDEAVRAFTADSTGMLWIVSAREYLYRFSDAHPDNVVKIGRLPGDPDLRSLAIAFDDQHHLWIAKYTDRYTPWQMHEVEISPDAERKFVLTDHGRVSPDIETVSDMTFHKSSLFVADGELDKLFEVADPRSPDIVVDRGSFPVDLGNADQMASDGASLWIVDEQRGVAEFWRLDDTETPSSAVEVGDIRDTDGGSLHSRIYGIAFQRVPVSEVPKEAVPPTVGDMWLASSDALYKLPEGGDLTNIESVGTLEGAFISALDIQSIAFDSQGRLYIMGVRDRLGPGGAKLYRLDNIANPRDAYIFSHLEGVADWAGQLGLLDMIVDEQDRVWLYAGAYADTFLIGEGGEVVEVWECPEELGECIVPQTFASGVGYAEYPDGIFKLTDFTDPYSYINVGRLPEGVRRIRDLTAGTQAFWGIAQEGIEQQLWRIPDIEAPGDAVKFGEFPERMPVFVDMAIYRTPK